MGFASSERRPTLLPAALAVDAAAALSEANRRSSSHPPRSSHRRGAKNTASPVPDRLEDLLRPVGAVRWAEQQRVEPRGNDAV
jgi:hypothetical protein